MSAIIKKMSSILGVFLIFSKFLGAFSLEVELRVPVTPGLSYTFYKSTCPNLELIVRNYLLKVYRDDITLAAALLHLHFHDCFVQGCDGSVLLDGSASGPSEQDAPTNLRLRAEAFKIINDVNALVQAQCGVKRVSCADIIALAARESVKLSGGPTYNIPLGRRDSLTMATRNTTLANLPKPTSNTKTNLKAFAAKKLTAIDLVALSGGHTIGRGHCTSFTNRLYPKQDPTMDITFAKNLKRMCPAANSTNTAVLDIITPDLFDNKYYVDLNRHQGLFTSDQTLYTNSRTRSIVSRFAVNQSLFFEHFVIGMLKMGQLQVLTGTQGEIRVNCSARNSGSTEDIWSEVNGNQDEGKWSQY